jgi:hypothetical protein
MSNPPPDRDTISNFFTDMLSYDHLAGLDIYVLAQEDLEQLVHHIENYWTEGVQKSVYVLLNDQNAGWKLFVEKYWEQVKEEINKTLPTWNEDDVNHLATRLAAESRREACTSRQNK